MDLADIRQVKLADYYSAPSIVDCLNCLQPSPIRFKLHPLVLLFLEVLD